MGFLNKKARQIEESEKIANLGKLSSETAVDIIKKLSGEGTATRSKIADNYVVFTSAAGGTGVSTVVNNVAYNIASKGYKVIVIDLNIRFPMQHIFLNIKQSVSEKPDLVSFLLGDTTLGESIDTSRAYALLYANNRSTNHSIKCDDDTAVENFNNMISKLRRLFDIILIDCPMDEEKMLYNNVLYNCDTIYTVWDEGIGSIAHTDKMRSILAFCGIDSYTKLRAIMNKRTNIHYNSFPFKKLNIELVDTLPFDTAIIESSNKAETFCEKGSSNSKNAALFEQGISRVADKILRIGGLIE